MTSLENLQELLLFGPFPTEEDEATTSSSSSTSSSSAFLRSVSSQVQALISDWELQQAERDDFSANLANQYAELEKLSAQVINSPIFSYMEKKKELETEHQILLVALDLAKINMDTPLKDIPEIMISLKNNFPTDLHTHAKLSSVLKYKCQDVARNVLSDFHRFLDSQMTAATADDRDMNDYSTNAWVEFFERSRVLVKTYLMLSMLPSIIFSAVNTNVLDKFKECLDNALTPMWGRYHFHLSQAREDGSINQILWTFTYTQSFLQMLINICTTTISGGDLQSLYEADYELASKAQLVDKAARFMKAHVAIVMGEVYDSENLKERAIGMLDVSARVVELVETVLELDDYLGLISELLNPVSAIICEAKETFRIWAKCDHAYVKDRLLEVADKSTVFGLKFPVKDDESSIYQQKQCFESVYECIRIYHTFASRYRFQPKLSLDYFSNLILERVLCCILGLILLRVRSCDEIKGLSHSRLPHWVGKSRGMEALPMNMKSFIQTINYVEESFNEMNFENSVYGDTQRFQKHWNATKSWIADAEWSIESAPGLINACMVFVEVPQETSSGIDKGSNKNDILIVFKSQLKALKNAIEVQIFESIEQEYQQCS